MSDDGPCQSLLGKLFDNVMKSDWNIWNLSENNKPSACPSKRKKMEQEEKEERARIAAAQRSMEAGGERDSESANGDLRDPSGEKKSLYTPPSQICPPIKSCCYIKMQDPCAPCCCETKPKLPPCPPKYGPQEPRQPICGCDICQKNPNNDKCCDRNRGFRGISLDSRYFEKA
ncbi:uncharacterized protein LOC143207454 [Lasioglossum baleicum]|uniref:uncharacterized protein LOC143207454 n=1 Tax=Lasioglossum baleicum TaxID=434251 RepID=UPI003FCD4B7E